MPEEAGGAVGRRVLRVEDRPLLTGRAEFVDDLAADDVLEVAFLRSPFAHARIAAVDTAAAAALPSVVAVVTAADLALPAIVSPSEYPGSYSPPRPLLAEGVARFAGEPVAAVAASSRYAAEDALELVDVEWEELEPVVDVARALAPDAPRLHAHESNVYIDADVDAGAVDDAFAGAACVVDRTFRHGRVNASPLEPRGVLAVPEDGGVCIWSSTQGPHKLRLAVAELLGVEHVRVVCTDIGGGFGQKAHVHPEEVVVAALALRLGRPVKWIEDRAENLTASAHARGQELRVRVAADADGAVRGLWVEQLVDQGAYGCYPHGAMLEAHTTSGLVSGPYRVGSLRVRSRAVATTKCPMGAYRGVGFVVAAWVHERMMDVLADELGLDRAEVRRRNLLRPDELPYTTLARQQYDSGDYPRALDLALDAVGYANFATEREQARREGKLLGLGISCYVEPTGMNSTVFKARGMTGVEGYDSAHVALGRDGTATVWTTTPAIGQGSNTTFAQLVADELGVELEQVRVAYSDTAVGDLAGTGTFASRSAVASGGAIVGASGEIRRALLDEAAERLEAAVEDLRLAGGAVHVAGSPGAGVTVAELLENADLDRFRASFEYDPPATAYPYATHACVVEVDPETGAVVVRRYAIAEDCGRVINPLIVEGQIHGATAQGIAEALYEEIRYTDDGQVQTGSFMDYLLPTAAEVPAFSVSHLETPAPTTVYGVKGVGEGGTVGAPGAVANAVSDAVGRELNELPLTAERVRAAALESFGRSVAANFASRR